MKHAHQKPKYKPDLAKYPMPTPETAWAICQEHLAAQETVVAATERHAEAFGHRGDDAVKLITPEQYREYASKLEELNQRTRAAREKVAPCGCRNCVQRRERQQAIEEFLAGFNM